MAFLAAPPTALFSPVSGVSARSRRPGATRRRAAGAGVGVGAPAGAGGLARAAPSSPGRPGLGRSSPATTTPGARTTPRASASGGLSGTVLVVGASRGLGRLVVDALAAGRAAGRVSSGDGGDSGGGGGGAVAADLVIHATTRVHDTTDGGEDAAGGAGIGRSATDDGGVPLAAVADGVTVVDVREREEVAALLAATRPTVVISCVGGTTLDERRPDYIGNQNIIDAAVEYVGGGMRGGGGVMGVAVGLVLVGPRRVECVSARSSVVVLSRKLWLLTVTSPASCPHSRPRLAVWQWPPRPDPPFFSHPGIFFARTLSPPPLPSPPCLVPCTTRSTGVQRFVLVSAMGAGNSEDAVPFQAMDYMRPFFLDKSRAEMYLKESGTYGEGGAEVGEEVWTPGSLLLVLVAAAWLAFCFWTSAVPLWCPFVGRWPRSRTDPCGAHQLSLPLRLSGPLLAARGHTPRPAPPYGPLPSLPPLCLE